eukprot:4125284-Amphidinium_carterae.1
MSFRHHSCCLSLKRKGHFAVPMLHDMAEAKSTMAGLLSMRADDPLAYAAPNQLRLLPQCAVPEVVQTKVG